MMLPWRSTIVLFLAAFVGVAAIMTTARRHAQTPRHAPSSSRLFSAAELPVDSITRISLKRAGEPELVFVRTARGGGTAWEQSAPFAYPMDAFSIRQLAVAARELEVIDTVELSSLSPQLLADLQLDPPAATITYQWDQGSVALQLGRLGFAGRAYLRVAGKDNRLYDMYVVDRTLHEHALEDDPREWRDRAIFRDVGVDSSRIEIRHGSAGEAGNRVVLIRQRKQWKMMEPAATRIDPVARDAFLRDLGRARLAGFVLDQPTATDLARFGLSEPVASLTVTTNAGDGEVASASQTLFIGARAGGASAAMHDRFAMIDGRPVVVKISGHVLAALFRQPQDLADPVACGAIPADVKSIIIRSERVELTLVRDLELWRGLRSRSDLQSATNAQESKTGQPLSDEGLRNVQELLHQITRLRAPHVEFKRFPRDLQIATVTLVGFDAMPLDTVRIAQEPDTGRVAMDNGDDVLRVFPAGLKMKLASEDFGLTE
jgi:hypothetical protein